MHYRPRELCLIGFGKQGGADAFDICQSCFQARPILGPQPAACVTSDAQFGALTRKIASCLPHFVRFHPGCPRVTLHMCVCVRAGRGCDSTAVRQTAQPAAPAGQEQLRQPAGAAACLWHGFNSFWPASRVRGASSGLKPKSCPRRADTRGGAVGAGTRPGRARAVFRVMGPGWCTAIRQAHPPYLSTLQSRKEAAINPQDSRRAHGAPALPVHTRVQGGRSTPSGFTALRSQC